MIEGPVATHAHPHQETVRLKARAVASFSQGLITSFPSLILRTVNLLIILKLARLCNPIRLRELHPTPHQLDELFRFKVISSEDAPIGLQQLKDELPMFLALAAGINEQDFVIHGQDIALLPKSLP